MDDNELEKMVHREHCCAIHGCKYLEDDCPVVAGQALQKYPCMDCRGEERPARNKDGLLLVYKSYIRLLTKELDETAKIAQDHGWKTSRRESGILHRERIEALEGSNE